MSFRGRRRPSSIAALAVAVTVGVLGVAPLPASAAGSVLFDQPFHNNTARRVGAVAVPAVPGTRRHQRRLPERRRQLHHRPAAQLHHLHRPAGRGQTAPHPRRHQPAGRRVRRGERAHLAGPAPHLQHLPVRRHEHRAPTAWRSRWPPWTPPTRGPRRPSAHRAARWATPRRSTAVRRSLQRLPGRRARRLRQLQQQHLPGDRLHQPAVHLDHRRAGPRPGRDPWARRQRRRLLRHQQHRRKHLGTCPAAAGQHPGRVRGAGRGRHQHHLVAVHHRYRHHHSGRSVPGQVHPGRRGRHGPCQACFRSCRPACTRRRPG